VFKKFCARLDLPPAQPGHDTVAVFEAVRFSALNVEEGSDDVEQLRCSKLTRGAPWQDGVQLVDPVPEAGKVRRYPRQTETGLVIGYHPNERRVFGLLQLIFEYAGGLWLLVEQLEGAHKNTGTGHKAKKAPDWQNKIIPNWPHLRTLTDTKGTTPRALSTRLVVFSIDSVESVRVIVEDPNQPPDNAARLYWCAHSADSVPFDEVFDEGAKYER